MINHWPPKISKDHTIVISALNSQSMLENTFTLTLMVKATAENAIAEIHQPQWNQGVQFSLEVYMVKHYKKTWIISNHLPFLSSWKRSLELCEDTGTPNIFLLGFGFHDFDFINAHVLANRPCDSEESLKAKGCLWTLMDNISGQMS